MTLSSLFAAVGFADLPGWAADDPSGAFAAFRRSSAHVVSKPYKTGALGVAFEAFEQAHSEARRMEFPDSRETRRFFERHFLPCRIDPQEGQGFVTGFYEPVVDASPVRGKGYGFPLYSRPDDLIELDAGNRPAGMDRSFAFGRTTGTGVAEYFDRAAIEQGALNGRGLEIAWLKDPVDVFFIHVQGAARLQMPDGSIRRLTYAAKSGHPFTGPGRVLADLGEIPREQVTMQSIRAWLRDHPRRVNEILWQNRSFIFFRETPVSDPELGPVAAAKAPLTPGRSIAVDRLLHTFGTPFFIDAPSLEAFGGTSFRRLMIAQDTGSAITGPARGDLFVGSGDAAGAIAGVVRHPATFYALVPKALIGGIAR